MQVNEIFQKAAADTQMLLQQGGAAANAAFVNAAEMHKKYAPKPTGPMAVDPSVKTHLERTKQATTAGTAVARGVATGMQVRGVGG